jgi:hypothetical protein
MESHPFHPNGRPRPFWIAATCLTIALGTYCAAQVVARRAASGGALRGRILHSLEERLGAVELGPGVEVDALFRVRCGPLVVPGLRPEDPPLVRAESIRIRPDLVAFARTGRPAAASIRLAGVHVDVPERPGSLHELLERLSSRRPAAPRSPGAPAGTDGPAVSVRDLTVTFGLGGQRLTAGPIQATLHRRRDPGERIALSAELRLPGSGQGTAWLSRDARGWHAVARLERVDPRALPAELAPLGATWSGGSASLAISGDAAPGFAKAQARLEIAAAGVRVRGKGLAAEPIGPVDVHFAGDLAWDGAGRRLRLSPASVTLPGGAAVAVQAGVELHEGLPFTLEARASGVDYRSAVSALPAALSLPDDAPRPSGTLDVRASLAGSLLDPADWVVDASLDLSRMRAAARGGPPVPLLGPFVQHVQPEQGPARSFLVGPDNPGFVPIAELPRHVVRAVTASEDAGFFGHSGFDFDELRNAAVEGAQAGRVVRGGSTITQQLAKNLYLSREKTLARKLREALVTVALEATVPKQRLMEIYLNVAEWGPGLWGIGPAARHWFGKDARQLTPKEAAFLATVIPNPVRYHSMWNRGWVSEAWEQRVDDLLRTMYGQGNLTGEELEAALGEPLVFARPEGGENGSPAGDDGRVAPAGAALPALPHGAGRRGRALLR